MDTPVIVAKTEYRIRELPGDDVPWFVLEFRSTAPMPRRWWWPFSRPPGVREVWRAVPDFDRAVAIGYPRCEAECQIVPDFSPHLLLWESTRYAYPAGLQTLKRFAADYPFVTTFLAEIAARQHARRYGTVTPISDKPA